MFITFKNKKRETIKVSISDIKEIAHREGTFVRLFYNDGSETNITYNSNSFSFTTNHEVDASEINSIIQELNLIP